jgi:choline dehydrogenase-like flavoprotein
MPSLCSGGVVGSPQILQLSGVGPKPLLNSLGIPVVVDLPVGYNLQVRLLPLPSPPSSFQPTLRS